MTTAIKEKPSSKTEDEKAVEFVPFGASDKIRLTASMVRSFIAVPTKSGKLPSERDCIRFIMLCRGKRANPFEGDCFLIGYDNRDGAPTFSLVCGIELFLKRAEQSEDYDGRESGVLIMDEEKTLHERPGSLVLAGEKLVGGWARVFRKDRAHPEYKAVNFETYNTGRSRWEKDPPGQIEKVALSQALRAAFPTALGALYTQEEMERITDVGGSVAGGREPIAMPRALSDATIPVETVSQPDGHTDTPLETAKPEPPHQPDDKWDQLRVDLTDMDVRQEFFVEGLRKVFPDRITKQAKLVADLPEDVIDNIYAGGLDKIIDQIKSQKK